MKLNRKWIMVIALVMSMAMATGGTLAYLTDRDSEANVFTMGNVEIDLNEEFDPENADLIPGVDIEKMPTITNTGNTDAWVWMIWSIPAALDNKDAELGTDNYVHFQYYGGTAKDYASQSAYYEKEKYYTSLTDALTKKGIEVPSHQDIIDKEMYWTVDEFIGTKNDEKGIVYNCYAYKYHKALTPGETTLPSIHTVYLDDHVDIDTNGDLYYVNAGDVTKINWNINTQGNPVIYVNAYAMQKNEFANVEAAFTAYTNQWTSTGESIDGIEFAEADNEIDSDIPVFYEGVPAELAKVLSEATDAGSGNVTITLDANYDMTGFDWDPISVDGYQGAGIVTVEGNGHTIKGLNAPLFAGGFAGESGIVVKDLTIADSTMTAPSDQGSGAFICCVDSMTTITLDNCHAKNVTLNGASRTGGLIGWTSGYSRTDDGPVKTFVTIKDCTVEGCTINAGSEAAGGFIGHSGASDWTYTTVTNSKVINTKINGGSDRTGIFVGTSNVGETTFTGCTYEEVSGTLNNEHPLYGRTVHGTTGKLTINGQQID